VHEHIASGRNRLLAGKHTVMLAGIRDVDRLVELAVSIAEIQNVRTFGRLVISLSGLGPDGIASEGDFIRLDRFALAEEFERPLFLQHHNVIGAQDRLRNRLRRHPGREQADGQRRKHSGTHARIMAGSHAEEC
jgi:hypothetical protein